MIIYKEDEDIKEKLMSYVEGVARNQAVLFPDVIDDYSPLFLLAGRADRKSWKRWEDILNSIKVRLDRRG